MENHKGFSATRNAEKAHNAEIVIKAPQEPFVQIYRHLIEDSRLTDSAYRTFSLMVARIGQKDFQKVSQATLAADRNKSVKTIQRDLALLKKLGYLTAWRTAGVNGYQLNQALVVGRRDKSVPSEATNMRRTQSNNSLSNNSGLSDQLETPESGREVAAADDFDRNKEKRLREWIVLTLKPLNAHFSELNVEGINQVKETSEAYSALRKAWELGDSSAVIGQTLLQAYREASFKSNIRKPSGFALKAIPSWLESNLQLKAKPSIPEWCGECDPYGKENPGARYLETPQGLKHCPKCHPQRLSKPSQKPQERLSEVQPLEALIPAYLSAN